MMKQKIVHNAAEMFLNFGFKTVTMNDIAVNVGISKKTIYAHFNNKLELVEDVTIYVFDLIRKGIDLIHQQQQNPIIELFEIKKLVMKHLKDEKSSPQYQLQKYYPNIFKNLKKRQFELIQRLIKENLVKGIQQKLYRKLIHIDFTTRIYFHGIMGIKDKDLFPLLNYSMNTVTMYHLEYHLRAICSSKGIQELEKQLKDIPSNQLL